MFRIELDLRDVIFSFLTGIAEKHAAQLWGSLYTEILLNEFQNSPRAKPPLLHNCIISLCKKQKF